MNLTIGFIAYRLVVVYRPPGQLLERDRDLYTLLSTLVDNRVFLVVGDFNCHIDWEERDPTVEGTSVIVRIWQLPHSVGEESNKR